MGIETCGGAWLIVNASPDLAAQIEQCPALHPQQGEPRNSPIKAVLLTNADLDHVLGLYTLRGSSPLDIWGTAATRLCLEQDLRIGSILGAFGKVLWHEPSLDRFVEPSEGVQIRAIPLPAKPPRYARSAGEGGHSVAYECRGNGKSLVIAPDVAQITAELLAAMQRAEAVLFDGTFWSETELQQIDPKARTASEMGHLPVQSSLPALAKLSAPLKMYLHVNNTNPILNPASGERRQVEELGVQVGQDAFEFDL